MRRIDDTDLDELENDSLVGSYFHGDVDRKWQGRVVAQVSPVSFLVEVFDWIPEGSTHQRVIDVEEMLDWRFYDTADWMREEYARTVKDDWAAAERAYEGVTRSDGPTEYRIPYRTYVDPLGVAWFLDSDAARGFVVEASRGATAEAFRAEPACEEDETVRSEFDEWRAIGIGGDEHGEDDILPRPWRRTLAEAELDAAALSRIKPAYESVVIVHQHTTYASTERRFAGHLSELS